MVSLADAAVPILVAAAMLTSLGGPTAAQTDRALVRIETDEAVAALDILRARRGAGPRDGHWDALFGSEGFRRFKSRQEAFGASAVGDGLRRYLLVDLPVARLAALELAVDRWQALDLDLAASRALAYLPAGTKLRATIYPLIKRSPNSFVHDLDRDPAIFMHIDPDRPAQELQNILAHELHHVGSVEACEEPPGQAALPAGARQALDWLSGFAEGMAMLAAAGGPEVHPHATSRPRAWVVWERDVGQFSRDLRRVEAFLLAVIDGDLEESEQRRAGFEFINTEEVPQGAFYTVGWKMAALVESAAGRQAVIEAVCDPRRLLIAYDRVARQHRGDGEGLPTWSPRLIAALQEGNP